MTIKLLELSDAILYTASKSASPVELQVVFPLMSYLETKPPLKA